MTFSKEVFSESILDATTPERKFFQKTFRDCADCKTLTIVVSKDALGGDILKAFKKISNSFGKKNLGSTLKKTKVLENIELFERYGCKPLENFNSSFVIYIDKDESSCVIIPYKSEDHLIAVIDIIRKNLDDAKAINKENWKVKAKMSVDEYADNNPGVSATKEYIYELINFLWRVINSDS